MKIKKTTTAAFHGPQEVIDVKHSVGPGVMLQIGPSQVLGRGQWPIRNPYVMVLQSSLYTDVLSTIC